MTINTRQYILRANALFLLIASAGGFVADVVAVNTLAGPMGRVIASAPHSAIGLIEAHGLAFILGVLLWRAEPSRDWHLTAAAIHLLLGTANLVFWQVFISGDALIVGYVSTALHGLFVLLELLAAVKAGTVVKVDKTNA